MFLEWRWQNEAILRAAISKIGSEEEYTTRNTFWTPKALPGKIKTFSSSMSFVANSMSFFTSNMFVLILQRSKRKLSYRIPWSCCKDGVNETYLTIAYMAPWGSITSRPGQWERLVQRNPAWRARVILRLCFHSANPGVVGERRVGITAWAKCEAPWCTCARRLAPASTSFKDP